MSKINDRINALENEGYGKTLITMMLKHEGFTAKEIKSADIVSKKSDENDAFKIMQKVIELEATSLNNKQKATIISEADLCTEKTAYHIMSLMKYVKAYHELMS